MLVVVVVLLAVLAPAAIKIAREYERGVMFRLGRLMPKPMGPGLFLMIPIVDRMVRVDLRTITLDVPPQEVITKDNVPVRGNAVAYFRIVDPNAAIVQVENFMVATSQIAQTTLRAVLGQHQLDELLSEREKINAILQEIIDEATSPWGIKVSIVEVKDVEIPEGMQRAMAREAEAERERPRAGAAAGPGGGDGAGFVRRGGSTRVCRRGGRAWGFAQEPEGRGRQPRRLAQEVGERLLAARRIQPLRQRVVRDVGHQVDGNCCFASLLDGDYGHSVIFNGKFKQTVYQRERIWHSARKRISDWPWCESFRGPTIAGPPLPRSNQGVQRSRQ